jgi:hypothetical protein
MMLAFPAVIAATIPEAETAAIAVLLENQVTLPVRSLVLPSL